MSSAAISLPPASPAKAPKKRSKSVRRNTGPTVSDLILKAVSASKERGGMSLAALKKTLQAGGYDVVKNKARILIAIRRLVANKALVQTKGSGASGSFKVNKKPPTPRKKKVVKKKKPKAKKPRRASAKKAAGGATPAAKKSPKRKRKTKTKAKSPKKAKKPAAAKKPKSPRKTKRRVSKSTRARKAKK
ncbi:protamine-like protein [Myripristis murdjan]|uniref:protamine-like protein n=1 Tax=Myripristis murdjan TaxID=586833 RepID=UPI0011760255|nr:protamine-like protein [Myripristis murdjan]